MLDLPETRDFQYVMQSYWKKDQNTKRSRMITSFRLIFYTIYTILQHRQPPKVTISSAFRKHFVLFPIFLKKTINYITFLFIIGTDFQEAVLGSVITAL